MLLWTTLLCLFSASLVASQFAKPEILADYDPSLTLQPMKNNLQSADSSDDLHVIRGLLKSRQSGCPTGYGECTNPAGRCCPASGTCCQTDGCCAAGSYCYSTGCCPTATTGCEGNSCCTADETCCTGGGCCQTGYYCATVNSQRGCCPNGKTCTGSGDAQCQNPGYIVCTGENFCCPPGYTCFRDSAGNPKCSLSGSTSIPPTLTNSNQGGNPTVTFVDISSTPAKGPSTASLPSTISSSGSSSSSTPFTSSNSGASSSAISVVVDAILASFAGIGAFIFLF